MRTADVQERLLAPFQPKRDDLLQNLRAAGADLSGAPQMSQRAATQDMRAGSVLFDGTLPFVARPKQL